MTALLASVRSHDEAFDAAQAGAEIIDLKEPDEGAHNFDVDLYGAIGAQDAGEHGDALLGECPGTIAPTAPAVNF